MSSAPTPDRPDDTAPGATEENELRILGAAIEVAPSGERAELGWVER